MLSYDSTQKILLWLGFIILTLFTTERILRYTNESYRNWKQTYLWESRISKFSINNSNNLVGHWHIKPTKADTSNMIIDYSPIDIVNDTLAYFDSNTMLSQVFPGYIDRNNRTIKFGGECRILDFQYKVNGNKLFLNQIQYDKTNEWKWIGEKCDSLCCDKEKEFFNHVIVDINLPTIESSNHWLAKSKLDDRRLISLAIGMPKNQYINYYGTSRRMVDYNNFLEIHELKHWLEIQMIKYPESIRNRVKLVLYVDKSITMDYLSTIVKEISQLSSINILLASKAKNTGFNVYYKLINPSQFQKNKGKLEDCIVNL